MNHWFYSLISLFVALFFLLLGSLAIMLPWSPVARTDLVMFILEDSLAIFLFGFVFLAIGIAIVTQIILSARKNYYRLKSSPRAISVDEAVITNYINSYWKDLFPKTYIPSSLNLKKNKIHITADLPYIPQSEQKELLEKIKTDLDELLASLLGYRDIFYLSASFQPKRNEKNR